MTTLSPKNQALIEHLQKRIADLEFALANNRFAVVQEFECTLASVQASKERLAEECAYLNKKCATIAVESITNQAKFDHKIERLMSIAEQRLECMNLATARIAKLEYALVVADDALAELIRDYPELYLDSADAARAQIALTRVEPKGPMKGGDF